MPQSLKDCKNYPPNSPHIFHCRGNEWMIEEAQKEVDRNWEELLILCDQ